jgi:tetratricopeptide (TPR) repeat protein
MEQAANYRAQLEEVFRLDEAGHTPDAVARCREVASAAEAAGDLGYALFFAGEALCLEGNLAGGGELERQAAELLPEVAFIHTNYGVFLSMTGKVRKALGHLEQALRYAPDDLQALAQKGVCLAKLNRYQEALLCFERILALSPDNLHALRNKGVCLSNLCREQEALQIFDRVLEIDPHDGHARSEKKIILDELELRTTPFGWVAYQIRRHIVPHVRALKLKFF